MLHSELDPPVLTQHTSSTSLLPVNSPRQVGHVPPEEQPSPPLCLGTLSPQIIVLRAPSCSLLPGRSPKAGWSCAPDNSVAKKPAPVPGNAVPPSLHFPPRSLAGPCLQPPTWWISQGGSAMMTPNLPRTLMSNERTSQVTHCGSLSAWRYLRGSTLQAQQKYRSYVEAQAAENTRPCGVKTRK